MNSTFRARWLVSLEVIISTIRLRADEETKSRVKNFISFSFPSIFSKTVIHLSVGESGAYLSHRLTTQEISSTIHLHFGE